MNEVRELRKQMDSLPAASDRPRPWTDGTCVRACWIPAAGLQSICASGRRRWSGAPPRPRLSRNRGAPDIEMASSLFNDYSPLLNLGRIDEAMAILIACREVFEQAGDFGLLSSVLSALASVEDQRERGDAALGLARDALRYDYLTGDVAGIMICHLHLGHYLAYHTRQFDMALPHHLAAGLLQALTGSGMVDPPFVAAVWDVQAGGEAGIPSNVAGLCAAVGQVLGVRLDLLVDTLATSSQAEQALAAFVVRVRAAAMAPAPIDPANLAMWDPVASGIAAAAEGDLEARQEMGRYLAEFSGDPDWSQVADRLSRVLNGDRSEDLRSGLLKIHTAIVDRVLAVIGGTVTVPVELWFAVNLSWLMANLVAAAGGTVLAAVRARQGLEDLTDREDLAPLVGALGGVLGGDRDPALAVGLEDPVFRAVVECV